MTPSKTTKTETGTNNKSVHKNVTQSATLRVETTRWRKFSIRHAVNEEEREHIGIADGVGIRPMNAPVHPRKPEYSGAEPPACAASGTPVQRGLRRRPETAT
jgi:hypothetical protein